MNSSLCEPWLQSWIPTGGSNVQREASGSQCLLGENKKKEGSAVSEGACQEDAEPDNTAAHLVLRWTLSCWRAHVVWPERALEDSLHKRERTYISHIPTNTFRIPAAICWCAQSGLNLNTHIHNSNSKLAHTQLCQFFFLHLHLLAVYTVHTHTPTGVILCEKPIKSFTKTKSKRMCYWDSARVFVCVKGSVHPKLHCCTLFTIIWGCCFWRQLLLLLFFWPVTLHPMLMCDLCLWDIIKSIYHYFRAFYKQKLTGEMISTSNWWWKYQLNSK